MYLRETRRRNRDGSEVAYLALAHNERDPETGMPKARIIHNFGRADQVDRQALTRLIRGPTRCRRGDCRRHFHRMNGWLLTARALCRCGRRRAGRDSDRRRSTTITTWVGELTSASSVCRNESEGLTATGNRVGSMSAMRSWPSSCDAASHPGRPWSSTATQSTLCRP